MKHRFFINVIILQAALFLAWNSTPFPLFAGDSTKTSKIRPVEIIDQSLTSTTERRIFPISTLNAAQIQALGARQVSDALQFLPGVFMRNYGGVGGLKTISLRGANAAQTAVFLDGVRVQSTQNGQFDFSTIPAVLLEEIEVVRGGGGARFGAGSMAGAVNLRTASRLQAAKCSFTAEAASFQEFRAALSGGLPFNEQGNIGLLAYGEAQTALGNYPFRFNEFGRDTVLERMNADVRLLSGGLTAFQQLGRWRLRQQALVRHSERGTPGAVVQGNVEMARARLQEDDLLLSISANNAFTAQSLLTVQGSGKFNTLLYTDPDARQFGANGINERFWGNDFAASARLWFEESVKPPFIALSHEWLLETTLSDLRGNTLQRSVGTRVERRGLAFSAKTDMRIALAPSTLDSPELRVNAALRVDSFSDVGAAVSPLVGVAWCADSLICVRGQWSYNFRPPSFNELYYLNFGNANLKPERAHTFNLGTTYSIPASVLAFTVDVFYHRTQNQILAVQTSPFTISAQNIEDVQTLGVETSIRAALWEYFSLQANYTFQRASNETPQSFVQGRQLIYTPQHLASGVLEYKQAWFSAVFTGQFVGERFFLPSNSVESRLAPFFIGNVAVEGTLTIASTQGRIRLLCDNCFNAEYAVIRNFPMPARAFRASLTLSL